MILPQPKPKSTEPHVVTMADGQTFRVIVTEATYQMRFNDEGRELAAFGGGGGPDAWMNYRLGRIRDAVIDWLDVTNDKQQPVPFTTDRLLALMDVAPEIIPQLVEISNKVFAPLELASLKSPDKPKTSGEVAPPSLDQTSQNTSEPISTSSEPPPSPPKSE